MFPTAAISGSMKVQENFANKETISSYCQTLTSGNFIFIILLQGTASEEEMELGRNILSKIEEQTTQTPEISPSELVKMQEEQFVTSVELNLLVAKVEGQKLILASRGKMGAKIIRRDKIINLLQEDREQESEIKVISGPILHDDLLILGSAYLFSIINSIDIESLVNLSVEEIKEQLIPRVEIAEEKEKICAVFMRVDLKNQTPGMTTVSANNQFFNSIFSKRESWLPKRESFEKPSSRRTLYLILIIFVVMVSIIAYQLRSRNLETNAKNLQTIESAANEGINSASKLIGLNDQIARDSLSQTRKDVETQIKNAYGSDWKQKNLPDKSRLEKILAKIDEVISKVSHVYSVATLSKFYDFSLMKSGPRIVSANLHGGEIVALDQNNGAIYSLMTKNKAAALLIGNNDLKAAKFLDFTPEILFVFSNDGIFQKNLDGSDSFKQTVKKSEKWGEIQALSAFGGNLYVLDPKNNQVWKYQGTDLGFIDQVNYIKTGLPIDISSGKSMQVDGFVYVLTPTESGQAPSGKIAKFSGGDISDFSFTGLPDPISKVTAFFASDDTQNVYLWDSANKMITVVDKKGAYQAEYKLAMSPSAPLRVNNQPLQGKQIEVKNILADETVKKIFLLTDSMVFSIDIK